MLHERDGWQITELFTQERRALFFPELHARAALILSFILLPYVYRRQWEKRHKHVIDGGFKIRERPKSITFHVCGCGAFVLVWKKCCMRLTNLVLVIENEHGCLYYSRCARTAHTYYSKNQNSHGYERGQEQDVARGRCISEILCSMCAPCVMWTLYAVPCYFTSRKAAVAYLIWKFTSAAAHNYKETARANFQAHNTNCAG